MTEAQEYAVDRYRWALGQGTRLTAEERQDVVATVARLTGLSEAYVDRADLRIEHVRFCTELLRDRGLAVGRIDGRFTGPLHFGNAEMWDADPSIDAIVGPYAAAMHHYLRAELGSDLDLPYEVFANQVKEWSYQEFEGRPINVSDKLERLMRANPHLRVRVEYGYYDLATPFGAAARTWSPTCGSPPSSGSGSSTTGSRPATCPTCTTRRGSARPRGSPPSSAADAASVPRSSGEPAPGGRHFLRQAGLAHQVQRPDVRPRPHGGCHQLTYS